MAVIDRNKKQFLQDRDENVFIGIDLPFRKSDGVEGWFKSTETTIDAVKNNITNYLKTHKGERYLQPNFGLGLRNYLFEQFTDELRLQIENEILDGFEFWLPFVQVRDIQILTKRNNNDIDENTIRLRILFNIKQDPTTLNSINLDFSGLISESDTNLSSVSSGGSVGAGGGGGY